MSSLFYSYGICCVHPNTTLGLPTHHQHQVHSNDKQCTQPLPCHTLQYFINNSNTYFVSNTTLFFAGHLNSTDLIIKNVMNFGIPIVNTHN